MSFSIRKLFSNLFLSVVIDGSECLFYGRVFKNNKVVKTLEAKFTDIDPNNIDDKVIAYIKRQEDAYYAVYISLFYNDNFQGALPALNKDEFKKYNIKTDNISIINVNNCSLYADSSAILKARNTFGNFSVDLLYSPIALMLYEIDKRTLSQKTSLYIYAFSNSAVIAIFKEKKMKFATFFKLENKNEAEEYMQTDFNKEDITDIDNLIIKEENETNSLDDFINLDDIDDIFDEKNKNEFEDLDYDINMPVSTDVAASVTIFGRDMSMYRYITAAIREFYSNPLYEGDFIDQIILFDSSKTSATFLHFLETELFVETFVFSVDALKTMNELMTKDIKL